LKNKPITFVGEDTTINPTFQGKSRNLSQGGCESHPLCSQKVVETLHATSLLTLRHITWKVRTINGLPPEGRTTVKLLQLNSDQRLGERKRLRDRPK